MALAFRPCFRVLWKNGNAGLARGMFHFVVNRVRLAYGDRIINPCFLEGNMVLSPHAISEPLRSSFRNSCNCISS